MKFDSQTILLVEDNEDDIFLFNRLVNQLRIRNPIQIVRDGLEAVDYLNGVGKFGDRAAFPLPQLMLLDIKLPFKPGLSVLQWIRSQPQFQDIIIVVLTSSAEPRDVVRAYRLGARYYFMKPPRAKPLADIIDGLRISTPPYGSSQKVVVGGDLFNDISRFKEQFSD